MADLFMVFDVESVGLHGDGFAVGWVVVDRNGPIPGGEGLAVVGLAAAEGARNDREWVRQNIPEMAITHNSLVAMRDSFWQAWLKWRTQGAVLVADCAWPVEARFLAACVDDNREARKWNGPYPLHDLASIVLAKGGDPTATHDRQPDELPAHHPLNDARQSARILLETLSQNSAAQ